MHSYNMNVITLVIFHCHTATRGCGCKHVCVLLLCLLALWTVASIQYSSRYLVPVLPLVGRICASTWKLASASVRVTTSRRGPPYTGNSFPMTCEKTAPITRALFINICCTYNMVLHYNIAKLLHGFITDTHQVNTTPQYVSLSKIFL